MRIDHVALLAEGVGRNCDLPGQLCPAQHVALLAEGVGRNGQFRPGTDYQPESPSSRRAWVEIWFIVVQPFAPGRPPRGGRG